MFSCIFFCISCVACDFRRQWQSKSSSPQLLSPLIQKWWIFFLKFLHNEQHFIFFGWACASLCVCFICSKSGFFFYFSSFSYSFSAVDFDSTFTPCYSWKGGAMKVLFVRNCIMYVYDLEHGISLKKRKSMPIIWFGQITCLQVRRIYSITCDLCVWKVILMRVVGRFCVYTFYFTKNIQCNWKWL